MSGAGAIVDFKIVYNGENRENWMEKEMAEYPVSRCQKIRNLVKKEGWAGMLVTDPRNVRWLTGFTGGESYLLVLPQREILLSDFRYALQIERECPPLEYAIRSGSIGLAGLAKAILEQENTDPQVPLGMEGEHVTLTMAEVFQQNLERELVPTRGVVEKYREIKDKEEITSIRKAAQIAQNAFRAVVAMLTPEKTEKQIADELENAMRQLGAEKASFPSIVAVGANAALCHAVPGQTRVEEADFLLIDWGAQYRGYASDLTRVIVTGRKTVRFQKIFQVVREAQQKAIEAIRPGVPCDEIDRIARDFIAQSGYGKYFDHGLGHGLGLNIHEAPSFSPRCNTILRPGMVLTVEPGVYIKGWGGIRIEDDVLVTSRGCEVLTDLEKDWKIW